MFLTSYFLVCLHKKKDKTICFKNFWSEKKTEKILNNLNKGKINKKKNLFIINIAFKIVHKKKKEKYWILKTIIICLKL